MPVFNSKEQCQARPAKATFADHLLEQVTQQRGIETSSEFINQ